jgi:hypothetical protein
LVSFHTRQLYLSTLSPTGFACQHFSFCRF